MHITSNTICELLDRNGFTINTLIIGCLTFGSCNNLSPISR